MAQHELAGFAFKAQSRSLNLGKFVCNIPTLEPRFQGDVWLPHRPAQLDKGRGNLAITQSK